MLKSSIRRFSSRAKLITLAIVAVLLPTAIFSFIQYRSLVDLEEKTKVAMQDRLRQTLYLIGKEVGNNVKNVAIEALHPIQSPDTSPDNLKWLEAHFAAIRQAHPEVGDLFVIPACPCKAKEAAYYSTPRGGRLVEQAQFKKDTQVLDALSSYEAARTSGLSIDAKKDLIYWNTSLGCGTPIEERLRAYVFYPLRDKKWKSILGFAGMTLDPAHLQGKLMPETIAGMLSNPENADEDFDLTITVHDEQGEEIYKSREGTSNVEAKVMFYPAFPRWYLLAGYTNTTAAELARRQFRHSLALSVFALGLLLMGLVLTLRAITREARLAQVKSTFVSNVSHELKTPLALIRLFAETLELGRVKSQEKAQEYYHIINSESRRLTQLIDNILDFSRIEAGRKEYQFAPSDITEVVEGVVSTYRYQLRNAGFELTTDLQRGLPPVNVDGDAISQAVLNLLNNAVKYSEDVKKIAVSLRRQGNNVLIEVADWGIGIPKAEQEKIFEKFYRVNNDLVHNIKGSGLGLSLVKHIAEAHRGAVRVESAPGKGSRFIISLPLDSAEAAGERPNYGEGGYQVAESSHH
ncbi:MAG TPA: HAMP domain-containing sensor histidine kinase [Blastocatellia bacterium]|nr:HAMP domain-containing sensor histidine kinase [Blastocatellia bacterium]